MGINDIVFIVDTRSFTKRSSNIIALRKFGDSIEVMTNGYEVFRGGNRYVDEIGFIDESIKLFHKESEANTYIVKEAKDKIIKLEKLIKSIGG